MLVHGVFCKKLYERVPECQQPAGAGAEEAARIAIHNMREKDLLFQVLNSNERAAEAMHWLDDAFGVHDLGDDMKNKHLNFKPYDPLSFVVTILNFLREDTAPLLAPSVERSQSIENPSPASALVKFKESAVGERKFGRVSRPGRVHKTGPQVVQASFTLSRGSSKNAPHTTHTQRAYAMIEEHVINKHAFRCISIVLLEIRSVHQRREACPRAHLTSPSLWPPGSRFGCTNGSVPKPQQLSGAVNLLLPVMELTVLLVPGALRIVRQVCW